MLTIKSWEGFALHLQGQTLNLMMINFDSAIIQADIYCDTFITIPALIFPLWNFPKYFP